MALTEDEIRPPQVFESYLTLAAQDALTMFGDVPRHSIACPACDSQSSALEFEKLGFTYVRCSECLTLFVNPRPEPDAFAAYYRKSASARYWASDFYRQTEEVRREKLIRPKARRIAERINSWKTGLAPRSVIDIGAGYGVFAEEIGRAMP